MRTTFIATTIALLILLDGCSSNKQVIHDYRHTLLNAKVWKPEFIPNDSSTGIKLEFVSPKQNTGKGIWFSVVPDREYKLEWINLSLWKYPLDTVVKISIMEDALLPMPSSEIVDLTSISYEIRNTPIKINTKVDSTKLLFFNIAPGNYLICCHPSDYVPKWIKDVNVKPNHWSVVKIDTFPNVIFIY